MDIERKIQGIIEAESIDALQAQYWPNSRNEEYLFVSYSHGDYKEVFKDLIYLDAEGVNVWYDRSLVPSRNWELDTEQFMMNYHCIGVLFYLSKRSLSSEAVYKEMRKAKEGGKKFLAVLLDEGFSSILGAYHSLPSSSQNPEREALLQEMFPESVIYLGIHMDISQKVEKIHSYFSLPPLYNFALSPKRKQSRDLDYIPIEEEQRKSIAAKYNITIEEGFASLDSINNIDIIRATDIPDYVEIEGKHYPLAKFNNCCFANCGKLLEVRFPLHLQLLKSSCFQNCRNLREAVIPEGVRMLGGSSFAGCTRLEKVELPSSLEHMRSWVFAGCKNLREIRLPKSLIHIEECCFDGCENLIIYVEKGSKMELWDPRWNVNNLPVIMVD